jgi:MFS family permease
MQNEFNRRSAPVLLGVWLAFLTGPNAMVAATNSNFLNILPEALGVSRTAVSSALAVSTWIIALVIPFTGRLMDHYGVRKVVLPALLAFSAVYFLLGTITQLWQFFVLQILLAFIVTACNAVGYAKIVSLWFDRNRGLVLGLCVAFGAGLGQTLMPKLSQMAIDWGGYQGGYWLIAGLILCIGFPAVLILVRAPQPSQLPTATTYSNPDAADEGVANENRDDFQRGRPNKRALSHIYRNSPRIDGVAWNHPAGCSNACGSRRVDWYSDYNHVAGLHRRDCWRI